MWIYGGFGGFFPAAVCRLMFRRGEGGGSYFRSYDLVDGFLGKKAVLPLFITSVRL